MKKIISLVLVGTMAISVLVGCGSGSKEKESLNPQEQSKKVYDMKMEKGEALFSSVIKEYKDACKSKKNMKKLSKGLQEMKSESGLEKKIGYTFSDLNGDGADELLVCRKDKSRADNYVIAAYMYGNEGPKRIVEGWSKNLCYWTKNSLILMKSFGGGMEYSCVKVRPRYEGLEYVASLKQTGGKDRKATFYYSEGGKLDTIKKNKISEKKFKKINDAWDKEYAVLDVKLLKDYK